MTDEATAARILHDFRHVAVVGISPRPERDSHRVASYLRHVGYVITLVNPLVDRVLDLPVWPSLEAAPAPAAEPAAPVPTEPPTDAEEPPAA
jgi:predicted CoA-binding protein